MPLIRRSSRNSSAYQSTESINADIEEFRSVDEVTSRIEPTTGNQ